MMALTLIVYRNELAKTFLSEREGWKMYCDDNELSESQDIAWCKIRSVLNPKSASYNYPTLVYRDGGIKTRSVTTTEKLETFASQLEGVLNEVENNVFDEEVNSRRRRSRPACCQSMAKLPVKVVPFDPDNHPDRIRFGEVTDVLGKVNTKKACGRTTSPTKSYGTFYQYFI